MRGRTILAAACIGFGVLAGVNAQDARRLLEDYGTTITVYGERLPSGEKLILDSSASVSVFTREDIQASGAKTLQEALANLPDVFLHDQTGNPVEATVDLRGFPQGTSLAVFLDGVRLNDIQDNAVRWDVIPIEDVERIEVYHGATGPLYGGGALSGVVNIITRRNPGIPRLDLKGTVGSFGERGARVHSSGTLGSWEYYATAMTRHAKGWRENDGYRLDDGLLHLIDSPSKDRSLSLLVKYSGGAESDPGSLTPSELRIDPRQSPFNRFDGTRGRQRLASLTYSEGSPDAVSYSVQAFTRLDDRDTLTTGRYGSGFLASGTERLFGLAGQVRTVGKAEGWSWDASAGAELSSGSLDAKGYYTNAVGKDKLPASSTATDQRLAGAYVQADLGRGRLHLVAGARADRTAYDYRDRLLPVNDEARVFRQSTWRAGLVYHTGDWSSAYLAFSEGYRIPSVVDLFAYPGFYSNPDLTPTRARDWEAGWRFLKDGWRFKVTAFDMKLRDEVVFVLTDPVYFIGQNQNVGRSKRRGLEAEGHVPLPAGFSLFGTGAYLETEVTAGPYAGHRVPMVPRGQGTAGVQWSNADWSLSLSASWVGPQRLDNDLRGERRELPGYSTANLSARYVYHALTLEASVSNLLDRRYLSRGITNGYADYFTPAYPRGARVSVMWSF